MRQTRVKKPIEVQHEIINPTKDSKPASKRDCMTAVTPTKRKAEFTNCNSSPPKQRNTENSAPSTPSTLIKGLVLKTPIKSSRKNLFDNKYQLARKALHSSTPNKLSTREKEIEQLSDFIKHCVKNKSSGSLYISGPPGTGKTASLSIVLKQPTVADLNTIVINCTKVKSSKAIYEHIAKDLLLKPTSQTGKGYLTAIGNYLSGHKKMLLLILDEIDQLDSKNQTVLYTIFEWPAKYKSNIILIGIANALDLTDRILPRLQARCELKPKLIHFAPYSKLQIMEIFKERLAEANVTNIFSSSAIQMLAGKVAAVSGDLRRALDIGRRVIELEEQSANSIALQSLENIVEEKSETVDIKHVISVLNSVYGTTQILSNDSENTFPIQQKVIICSLILILKHAHNKDITIGRLHEIYKKICQKRNLLAVDQGEFVGLCSLIETKGIIHVVGKKDARLHRVLLQWDEEEIAAALRDKQLMSSILQDRDCLGKL